MSKTGNVGTVRTFLAIDLPPAEKARLAAVAQEFPDSSSMVKWVSPSLLHITLRFLGGVPEPRLSLVEHAAASSAARIQPFTLRWSGLGAFPSPTVPRVVWVGLKAGPGLDALKTLAWHLERELSSQGFPSDERAFSPHITLARTRDTVSAPDRRRFGETLARVQARLELAGEFPVHELTVMRSDLGGSGPTYTPLAVFPLASDE